MPYIKLIFLFLLLAVLVYYGLINPPRLRDYDMEDITHMFKYVWKKNGDPDTKTQTTKPSPTKGWTRIGNKALRGMKSTKKRFQLTTDKGLKFIPAIITKKDGTILNGYLNIDTGIATFIPLSYKANTTKFIPDNLAMNVSSHYNVYDLHDGTDLSGNANYYDVLDSGDSMSVVLTNARSYRGGTDKDNAWQSDGLNSDQSYICMTSNIGNRFGTIIKTASGVACYDSDNTTTKQDADDPDMIPGFSPFYYLTPDQKLF